MRTFFLVLLFVLSVSPSVFAFPEMVRHGYINCTSCHVSPAGGGLMSPYGRSMSKEILSRWSYEGEENLAHGAIKSENVNAWLNGSQDVGFNVGGDVRYIQLYRNSDVLEQGKFFPMQRDMEMAFRFYKVTVVSNYGIQYKPDHDEFDSRRSYVMYQVNDELSVRAGRFMPIYGVMIPDHYTNIKRALGFDQNRERDSVEINYAHDKYQATLSYAKSPKSLSDSQEEKAFSLQVNYALFDKYKLGVSHWRGEFFANKRSVYGLHAILGVTRALYAISEVDYQVNTTLATDELTKGVFYYQKVGYEFSRGWHSILQIDGGQSNLDNKITKTFGYGMGLNFYPRPHVEVQGLWSKMHIRALDDKPMDSAHLLFHYYF